MANLLFVSLHIERFVDATLNFQAVDLASVSFKVAIQSEIHYSNLGLVRFRLKVGHLIQASQFISV